MEHLKDTSRGVCNGDVTLVPFLANAGRRHTNAHVQQLPCSEVLQHRSSEDGFEKPVLGGNLMMGRQKGICEVLSKWRKVVEGCVSPDSCTADLVAFLQR